MKKRKIWFSVLFSVLIASILALSACGKSDVGVSAVKETVVVTSGKAADLGEVFCNMNSISTVKELTMLKNPDNSSAQGILITTSTGYSSAYYGRMLNLKDNNKEIISFEILADDVYETDHVIISVIDAYDETNYFSVKFSASSLNDAWGNISVKSAKSSSYYGMDNYNNSGYGTGVSFFWNNFKGICNKNVMHYAFNFYYDSQENAVYTKVNDYERILVMDLDNEQAYNEDTKFNGFTTGDAYLKIEFGKLVKSGAILVENIGEISFDKIFDKTVPNNIIRFNGGTSEELFDGVAGMSYPLPVPVTEDFLFGEISYDIYVNNSDGKAYSVAGYRFTPDNAGVYSVIYKTLDNFGNDISRTFDLNVNATPTAMEINFADRTLYVCDNISLPETEVIGGNGNITKDVQYTYNDKTIETETLFLDAVSTLKVKVVATDSLGNTKTSVKIYPVNAKSVITVNGTVPLAVINGKEIKFADFTAYDYVNNQNLDKSITVNGQPINMNTMKYTVNSAAGDILDVVYYGGRGTDKECSQTFTTMVIDPNLRNFAEYFIFDCAEFTVSSDDTRAVFTSLKKSDESVVAYPFALSAELLEIQIEYDDNSRYKYNEIFLTDYIDGTEIIFRVYYKNGNFVLTLPDGNGEFTLEYLVSSYMKDSSTFNIYYDNARKALLDYRFNLMAEIKYTSDGNAFNGFDNCGAYLTFKLNGLKEGATFLLNKISNQSAKMMDDRGDIVKPVITLIGDFANKADMGDTIIVPKAYAFDVLSETPCDVYITVYDPDDKELFSDELLNKDLSVKIEKYGTYSFSLFSKDANGVRATKDFVLYIKDKVAPSITVSTENEQTATKGKSFVLPSATVTDNITSDAEIEKWILIEMPDAKYAVLKFGENYTFETEGKYRVIYYAKDRADNVATYELVVNVK